MDTSTSSSKQKADAPAPAEALPPAVISIQHQMTASIECNEPSPRKFVFEILPNCLKQQTSNDSIEENNKMLLSRSCCMCLQSYETLRMFVDTTSATANEANNVKYRADMTLRRVQIQASLRLQLWSILGQNFVDRYYESSCCSRPLKLKKKKKKHKKDKIVSAEYKQDVLLQDILSILSLAALRLPQTVLFCSFLQTEILHPSFRDRSSLMPCSIVQNLLGHFEVALLKESSSGDSNSAVETSLSPLKRPRSKPKAPMIIKADVSSSRSSTQTAGIIMSKPKENLGKASISSNGVLPVSVQLTAPVVSTNSLLNGNARSRFVGSHFNTNLMSSLSTVFRQVNVQQPPMKRQPQPKACAKRSERSTGVKQNNNKRKPPRRNSVVLETPAKRVKPNNMRGHSTTRTTAPMALLSSLGTIGTHNADKDDNNHNNTTLVRRQSNASLVAEAFSAVGRSHRPR